MNMLTKVKEKLILLMLDAWSSMVMLATLAVMIPIWAVLAMTDSITMEETKKGEEHED